MSSLRSLIAARRGGVALLAVLVAAAVLGLPALAAPPPGDVGVEPARPTGLTADAAHDAVALCWDDPADATITGYQILRRDKAQSASGQFSVHVDNTGTAETSYTDHDVTADTRYVYRIKARNTHGLSPRSRWYDANTPTTARTDAPDAPSGLTGDTAHDAVALRWDDPCDPTVTGYQILRRDRALHAPGVFEVLVDDTGDAATFYVDVTVEPQARYVYRVKARNAAALSPRSRWFDADTPAAPQPHTDAPAKPTGLSGEVAHDRVALSWHDPADANVMGYQILQILRLDRARHRLGVFEVLVDDTGDAATSYVDATVEPQAKYVYRVKARNAAGLSAQSRWFDADTPAAPQPRTDAPAAPTNVFTAASHNQVRLNWDDPDDDSITGYRILRGADAGSLAVVVDNTESTATSYTDATVEAETAYFYAVSAIKPGPAWASRRTRWRSPPQQHRTARNSPPRDRRMACAAARTRWKPPSWPRSPA